jgi:restriction system protein
MLVQSIFKKYNWDVHLTKASGDQGADVVAKLNGLKIVLQCKYYSQPVGNKAVQEVYAAKDFYGANIAAVVTNSSYTKSAKQLAHSLKVILFHHDDLPQFLEGFSEK